MISRSPTTPSWSTTDNGAMNTWPDGGAYSVPLGEEHELGRRLPGAGVDPLAGQDQAGHDLTGSLAPRIGCRRCRRGRRPDFEDRLHQGLRAGGKTYKVHLDGYNQVDYLTGKPRRAPRKEFFYFSDDGQLVALR